MNSNLFDINDWLHASCSWFGACDVLVALHCAMCTPVLLPTVCSQALSFGYYFHSHQQAFHKHPHPQMFLLYIVTQHSGQAHTRSHGRKLGVVHGMSTVTTSHLLKLYQS